MDLVATPKNPIPLGVSVGFLKGKGGVPLRFARWRSALKERHGTVCIFPGRSEFIEKYFEVVGELRRRGFAVAVLDWRGQGGSGRLLQELAQRPRQELQRLRGRRCALHERGGAARLSAALLRACSFHGGDRAAQGRDHAGMLVLAHGADGADARDRRPADASGRGVGATTGSVAMRIGQARGARRHEGLCRQPDLRGQSADRRP